MDLPGDEQTTGLLGELHRRDLLSMRRAEITLIPSFQRSTSHVAIRRATNYEQDSPQSFTKHSANSAFR